MLKRLGLRLKLPAQTGRRRTPTSGISVPAKYYVECFNPQGDLKWAELIENVVCVDGLDYALNAIFKSGTGKGIISTWYAGLKASGTASAAQTISGHAAWNELVLYTGNRKEITFGTVSAQSLDNSASKAIFSATSSMSAAGVFTVSDNTKSGATGVLYSVGDFSAIRSLAASDILNVTVTMEAGQKA